MSEPTHFAVGDILNKITPWYLHRYYGTWESQDRAKIQPVIQYNLGVHAFHTGLAMIVCSVALAILGYSSLWVLGAGVTTAWLCNAHVHEINGKETFRDQMGVWIPKEWKENRLTTGTAQIKIPLVKNYLLWPMTPDELSQQKTNPWWGKIISPISWFSTNLSFGFASLRIK